MKKKIDYVSTYEVTRAGDGRYHQHIHLIVIGVGYLPKKTIALLSAKWKQISNSKYIHFKYISKNRDVNIFEYIMKYITKEIANVNLTTVLLFSVKGKEKCERSRVVVGNVITPKNILSFKSINIFVFFFCNIYAFF